MAAPAIPYLVSDKQQTSITRYVQNCVESLSSTWNLRAQFVQRDLHYYREVDRTVEQQRAWVANNSGDPSKLQNMIVPIVMPQVESALAYLAGVFLSGYPIFGVTSDPNNADAALQMETVIGDNSIQYGWLRHIVMFMRDTLKYNLGAIEVAWKKKRIYSLVTDPAANLKGGTATEKYYEGNCLKRIDPYNLIWDKRVPPANVHTDGEFVGYTEIFSRIQLKQMLLDLDPAFTMNAKKAFESGTGTVSFTGSESWYYIPQVNPASFVGLNTFPTNNWMAWAGIDASQRPNVDIAYNDLYEVTTLYGKIIPSDFSLSVPKRNQPQIWKFVVVNRQVVIYVERQTNAHNSLPILIGQAAEDGLGYQTKSFLDNAVPFQTMASALWISAIEAQRRRVYDRMFYDPSRIRKEDIDKVTSVARIPVKNSAYGKPVSDAVYTVAFNDQGVSETLQIAQQIGGAMADEANGQNKVQRGQFQKGNKTKTEFTETMSSANSRQQLQAQMLEYQIFVPMKEMVKINILQYQPRVTLYNNAAKKAVEIKPTDLRAAILVFKLSDGILPTEKLLNNDLLQVFMQTLQTSPLMQAQFDIIGAFSYWCKMQGATWFDEFKRSPEDAAKIMQQQAAYESAAKTPQPQPAAAG